MKAHKFLAAGRLGRFSGFAWPEPGAWVEAGAPVEDCTAGIHACRPGDVLDWIDDELWEVELGGAIREADGMLVAERGRLLRAVAGWTPAVAFELAELCASRVGRDSPFAADVAALIAGHRPDAADPSAPPAVAPSAAAIAANVAYVSAHAAALEADDYAAAFAAERAWQIAWLAGRLRLGYA